MNFIWSKLRWKGDCARASIVFWFWITSGYPEFSSQSERADLVTQLNSTQLNPKQRNSNRQNPTQSSTT